LSQMFFKEKRIEYSVRILSGTIAGALVGLLISVDSFKEVTWMSAGIVFCAVGFAAGAVKYGDKFWRAIFGKWWMWG